MTDNEPREDWCTYTTEQTLGGKWDLLRGVSTNNTMRCIRELKKRKRKEAKQQQDESEPKGK